LAVVTVPELDRAHLVVRHLRALGPRLPILARAHDRGGAEALEREGGVQVIRPELEGAAALIRHALAHLALPGDRVLAYLDRFHQAMEAPEPRGAGDRLPEVREVTLGTGEIVDQSLRGARIRERFGVTVVAIRRADGGDPIVNPSPDAILRPGDRVRVFGLPEQIAAFAEQADGRA
jgi:TrkA-C domain